MGISCRDFWEMSPRAVYLMQTEWIRRHEDGKPARGRLERGRERGRERGERRRLNYIPRP